jgi:hypothetical protein
MFPEWLCDSRKEGNLPQRKNFSYGQNQQYPPKDYHTQACIEMVDITREADGLYNKLKKEWIEGSITDYASSPSLPPPSDENYNKSSLEFGVTKSCSPTAIT